MPQRALARPLLNTVAMVTTNATSATSKPNGSKLGLSLLALLMTVVGANVPKDAVACSPPSYGWNATVSESGPANGAIVVTFSCYQDCEQRPEFVLEITDKNEQQVVGAVLESHFTDSNGWMVWKPDSPLSAGKKYRVNLERALDEQNAPAQSWSYSVVGDGADRAPSKPLEVTATANVQMTGEELCCDATPNSCGNSCFTMPDKGTTNVSVFLTWFDAANLNGQFLVSGEFWTAKERVTSEPNVNRFVGGELAPVKAGDEYCYSVTAKHILTGNETTLEGCIPAEDVELPDVDEEVTNRRLNELRGCFTPPEGFEDEWCDAMEAATKTGTCEAPKEACERGRDECGITYETDAERLTRAPYSSDLGTDCSVAAGSSRSAGWLLVTLGLVSAELVRRRRGASPTRVG